MKKLLFTLFITFAFIACNKPTVVTEKVENDSIVLVDTMSIDTLAIDTIL